MSKEAAKTFAFVAKTPEFTLAAMELTLKDAVENKVIESYTIKEDDHGQITVTARSSNAMGL